MSKGIIFTADATVALGIFLAALFLFYSFFISEEPFGLRGAALYTKTDNYLYIEEVSEAFSSIINLYQQGDNATAYQLFELIRTQSEYPANMKLYLYETNGTMSKIYDSSPNQFTDKLLFRRYASYSITRGVPASGTYVNVSAPSTTVSKIMNVTVKVNNIAAGPVNVTLRIYNNSDSQMPWTTAPASYIAPASTNSTVYFNVTIPGSAWVDEYYAKAVTNSTVIQNGTDPFNVFRFGLVEIEVGI